jgi:hypothetical protein
LRSHGIDSFDNRNAPRQLMSFMRSYAFIGRSSVRDRLMALALLTTMSMPPNCAAVCSTALATNSSSRTSPTRGSAWPPASSIAAAAV